MSNIGFHSRQGTARLSGAERAHLDLTVRDATFDRIISHVHDHPYLQPVLAAAMPNSNLPATTDPNWFDRIHTSLHMAGMFGDGYLRIGDQRWDPWRLALNTAIRRGPRWELAAFIHATCEIHGWFPGPARHEVADLIDTAVTDGVYRQGMGWDRVVELLREDDTTPVAMDFSVTDPFVDYRHAHLFTIPTIEPHPGEDLDEITERLSDAANEKWDNMSHDDQWDALEAWLDHGGDNGTPGGPKFRNHTHYGSNPGTVDEFIAALDAAAEADR